MKKTLFTALRAMCVGAMTLFAVSCYDDSALWSEIEDLDARLTALEEKLNTEVATLNNKLGALEAAYMKADTALLASITDLTAKLDALDGTVDGYVTSNDAALKAAIEEYKKADAALAAVDSDLLAALATMGVAKVEKNAAGNVVITFVDESTVEVGKADANANNTGLITVVNGKWAVVGADGKTTVLDAELHPDTQLAFKVNPDNNELNVSYDGGQTWEPTGVVVNDATTINVVTAFKESEDYVTLTVGGVEYNLPKYVADNSSLVAGRTDVFFNYGETKTIELSAEEIKECYVMTKPDGWKVALDETTLTVTAPSEDLVKMGVGELKGQVLVHATTNTGTCKVASLTVTTGPAFTLSYKNGVISIFTAYVENEAFVDLYLGLTPISEYMTYDSFEEFIEAQYNSSEYAMINSCRITSVVSALDILESPWYCEGEVEDLSFDITLDMLTNPVNSWAVGDLEYDETKDYVLWLLPGFESAEKPFGFDEAIFTMTAPYVSVEAGESSYNNISYTAAFIGADSYVVGAVSKSNFDTWVNEEYTYSDALQEYLGDKLSAFTDGDKTALGKSYSSGKSVTFNLADVVVKERQTGMPVMPGASNSSNVAPDTEYFVWVLPYNNNKPLSDYVYEDLRIYSDSKTAPLTEDESVKATVSNIAPGHTFVNYTITPPTDGKFTFTIMSLEKYNESYVVNGEMNKEALMQEEFFNGANNYTEVNEPWTWDIYPLTDYVIVTYAEANGHYAFGLSQFKSYSETQVPVGRQWIIPADAEGWEYYSGATGRGVIDFSVSMEDYLLLGYSFKDHYQDETIPDEYAWGMVNHWTPAYSYKVITNDTTSGKITWEVEDWITWDTVTYTINYSNLTENSCTFEFVEYEIVADCTLSTESINLAGGGVAM